MPYIPDVRVADGEIVGGAASIRTAAPVGHITTKARDDVWEDALVDQSSGEVGLIPWSLC